MNACDHAVEYIYQYLDEEITRTRRLRIRWHLRRCGKCCNGYEFEKRLKAVVRRKAGREDVPPELIDRLRAFIHEHGADDATT